MVSGTVIENAVVRNPETGALRRQLWCVDRRRPTDECAVFADMDEAEDVRPGDWIWWQGGNIMWTRHSQDGPVFVERVIRKLGFSFDPRRDRIVSKGEG